MSEGKPWVIASLPKLGEITVAASELTRLRLVEAAAQRVINEAYDDGNGHVCDKLLEELRVYGPMEALAALRAALEGK